MGKNREIFLKGALYKVHWSISKNLRYIGQKWLYLIDVSYERRKLDVCVGGAPADRDHGHAAGDDHSGAPPAHRRKTRAGNLVVPHFRAQQRTARNRDAHFDFRRKISKVTPYSAFPKILRIVDGLIIFGLFFETLCVTVAPQVNLFRI